MATESDSSLKYALSVIIAEEQSAGNLQAIFLALGPEEHGDVEFLLCSAAAQASLLKLPDLPNVRLVQGQAGARIPLLWRDGIRLAQAERVALTTAHCIPSPTWLTALKSTELQDALVALGGAIVNAPAANAVGRAIYAMRYCNYTVQRTTGSARDLAADNALYRRRDILELEGLLEIGFWEPSFHELFLKAGLELRFDQDLLVEHHNLYSANAFMSQRYAHGIEFGLARAAGMSPGRRFMLIFLAPLLPLLFLRKLIAKARADEGIELGWGADFFWLCFFVCGWCLGEVIGYAKSFFRDPA
jgi:hypothetical protein